ncbi:cobalamin-binding protein [Allocoleopsis sp.]|uniref:cobalamin-binding protein n=1 Tax=Allocoleopsis sp. TaxID=3088169 RepID=UPI002FD33769
MTSSNLRIVSLLPSATEIVAALGLTDAIVGRSHECDYPAEIQNRPVCTEAQLNSEKPSAQIDADVRDLVQKALSIYNIKLDVLEELKPTHIVTQDQCDVCAVNFAEVEKAVAELTHSQPQIISLQPQVLSDVWADIERVGTTLGIESQPLLAQLHSRVEACKEKVQGLSKRPSVVALEWTDPLMSSGNWIPELVELAGGLPLLSVPGQHSPYLEWDTLLRADPEVIIIMPCGFDLERTRKETQLLEQHPEWSSLQAVRMGTVFITDGNAYFNRPGPRLVDSLEILAEILHPDSFDFGYRGTGWEDFIIDNA